MSTDKKRKKKPAAKLYRDAAKRLHEVDGECEIDYRAKVSRVDGPEEEGAYVQAWVWVPREEVDKDYEPFAEPTSWQCNGCNMADQLTGNTCPNCGRTKEESAAIRSA
jgi:hypothetical protein